MRKTSLVVRGIAVLGILMVGSMKAIADERASVSTKVGSPSENYSPYADQPADGGTSGWASANAWASGSGNGVANANATARVSGPSTQPTGYYGEPDGGRFANAKASNKDPKTGKPTASAITKGAGTSANATGKNGPNQVNARSANGIPGGAPGNPKPGPLNPNPDFARRMIEQALRDADIPENIRQEMLEQLR